MEMLLTIEQAALRLQLHRDTVRKQLKRGDLRGVKRGRVWRVPESALEEAAPAPATPPVIMTPQATAGQLDDFLKSVEALTQRMEAAGIEGVNGAELVREGREERERQLGE
jgi:excisionase family DNA binding protein